MPISDHYSRYERLIVTIVTVDPATGRIEGVGKDAAVLQITVDYKPPAFRWPKEGEAWTICRNGYEWTLESRLEDADAIRLADGQPGDLMGQDGWIMQGDRPLRYREAVNNFEVREDGVWTPYTAPGVTPEVFIGDDEPTLDEIIWVDTDEPGVDLSDWAGLDSRVDDLEPRVGALEDRIQVLSFTNAAPPWNLGSFVGADLGVVRIRMAGTVTHTAAQTIWLLPNGLSTVGADWMAHRFYFSSNTPGTDVQGAVYSATQSGIYLGACGWAAASSTYFEATGEINTIKPSVGARAWMGHYAQAASAGAFGSNDRIGADVVARWWDAGDITSLRIVSTGGGTTTFTGTITTEAV